MLLKYLGDFCKYKYCTSTGVFNSNKIALRKLSFHNRPQPNNVNINTIYLKWGLSAKNIIYNSGIVNTYLLIRH